MTRLLYVSLVLLATGCETRSAPAAPPDKQTEAKGAPGLSNAQGSGIPVQATHGSLTTLDKEAAKVAIDYWKPTKIGESWYLYQTTPPDPLNRDVQRTIVELRNVRVEVDVDSVDAADRLNGKDWSGTVKLRAEAMRCWKKELGNAKLDGTWSKWFGGDVNTPASSDLRRINGQWEHFNAFGLLFGGGFGAGFFSGLNVQTSCRTSFTQVEPSDLQAGEKDDGRTTAIALKADTPAEPPRNPQTSGRSSLPIVPRLPGEPTEHQLPDAYKLRVALNRAQLAKQYGATAETEAAVTLAFKWLASAQSPDGRWRAAEFGGGRELRADGRDRKGAGLEADNGITGLALLALLAAGHTHRNGPYQDQVRRGLDHLLHTQGRDGNLGGRGSTFEFMYCHGIATFAMSEAFGMSGDERLREPVRQALNYTIRCQNATSGGWRYQPGDPGDTSQLGWQYMALKSGELAGLPMPDATRKGVMQFLGSVAYGKHGGFASYRPSEKVTPAMTAEAIFCWQILGMPLEHPAERESGDYLLQELPGKGKPNLYYWYYGTLAMFQMQGVHWTRWNEALRSALLPTQIKDGSLAGSWDPDDVWGGYGGRIYSTALSALCLQVYYRYGFIRSMKTPEVPNVSADKKK